MSNSNIDNKRIIEIAALSILPDVSDYEQELARLSDIDAGLVGFAKNQLTNKYTFVLTTDNPEVANRFKSLAQTMGVTIDQQGDRQTVFNALRFEDAKFGRKRRARK